MNSKFIKREVYIAIHAQSSKFRIIKWIIILLVTYAIFLWRGLGAVYSWVIFGFVLGMTLHFFCRWKTRGWKHKWGKFKPIKTPFD